MKRWRLIWLLLALLIGAALYLQQLAPPAPDTRPLQGQVDHIVIEKAARRMTLYRQGLALRSYDVALGFAPKGDKQHEGDGKTPEGQFSIDRRNPRSAYHLSLGLDYPRPQDRARAAAQGVDPGGDIFIHGQPNALPAGRVLRRDWTAGCIAVSNSEMNEIYDAVAIGTTVEIRP